jgi:hypothetical protein
MRPPESFKPAIKGGWVFGLQLTILTAAIALGVDGFVNTDGNQVLLVCIIVAAVAATLITTGSGQMLIRRKSEPRMGPSSIDFAAIWPVLAQRQETVQSRVVPHRARAPGRKRKTGNGQ